MSLSMTGYGRSEKIQGSHQVLVEIKTLNGKNFETILKLSNVLKGYESEIRNALSKALLRGTIDCRVEYKKDGIARPLILNKALATALYNDAKSVATEVGDEGKELLASILRLSDVLSPGVESIDEEGWAVTQAALQDAIEQIVNHRTNEGGMLHEDLQLRVVSIQKLQNSVEPLEPMRIEKIRARITQSLDEFFGPDKIDQNRLEQELIYYVEKIDISEEKTRLAEHCKYFLEILQSDEILKGKKLGFILQEIGREINTLGSKANDAAIQRIVINMKEELEKAKEQVLNLV